MWITTWEASILVINSTCSIALNSVIPYLIYKDRTLRNSFNATITNASIADILVSLNLLTSTIQQLVREGDTVLSTWCNITGYINLISFAASVMSLAAVCIVRYILVCQRHLYAQYFTKRGTIIYLLLVWIVSGVISSPPLFGWGEFSYYTGKSVCFTNWKSSQSYMIFMILMCFFGPITATLLSLFLIRRANQSSETNVELEQDEFGISLHTRRQARREKKTDSKITRSIAVVVIAFFIAWGPFVIVMFLEVYWDGIVPTIVDVITFLLGCINSTVNPIIYMTLNINFRKALARAVSRNAVSDSSTSNQRKQSQQKSTAFASSMD